MYDTKKKKKIVIFKNQSFKLWHNITELRKTVFKHIALTSCSLTRFQRRSGKKSFVK